MFDREVDHNDGTETAEPGSRMDLGELRRLCAADRRNLAARLPQQVIGKIVTLFVAGFNARASGSEGKVDAVPVQ